MDTEAVGPVSVTSRPEPRPAAIEPPASGSLDESSPDAVEATEEEDPWTQHYSGVSLTRRGMGGGMTIGGATTVGRVMTRRVRLWRSFRMWFWVGSCCKRTRAKLKTSKDTSKVRKQRLSLTCSVLCQTASQQPPVTPVSSDHAASVDDGGEGPLHVHQEGVPGRAGVLRPVALSGAQCGGAGPPGEEESRRAWLHEGQDRR